MLLPLLMAILLFIIIIMRAAAIMRRYACRATMRARGAAFDIAAERYYYAADITLPLRHAAIFIMPAPCARRLCALLLYAMPRFFTLYYYAAAIIFIFHAILKRQRHAADVLPVGFYALLILCRYAAMMLMY